MSISRARFKLALVFASVVVFAGVRGGAQNPAPAGQQGAAPAASQIPTGRQGRGGYPLPALPAVFDRVKHETDRHGITIRCGELVGLAPRAAFGDRAPASIGPGVRRAR